MLTTLNLSGLNNLQTLNCEINELISLDTSDLSNLQTLICDGNQITNLFIKNNQPRIREMKEKKLSKFQ